MKKPTLRFRQVYEHPTHFKVTKPLGNPMIIAKQGLSDAMQNRLRKYAQGTGEVTPLSPSEQEVKKAIMAAEGKVPGEGEFGVPPVASVAPVVPSEIASLVPAAEPTPVADLEIPAAPVAVVSPAEKSVEPATPATVVVDQPKPVVVIEPAPTATLTPVQQKIYNETYAGAVKLLGADAARKVAMQEATKPTAGPSVAAATGPVATTAPAAAVEPVEAAPAMAVAPEMAPVARTPAEIGEAAKQAYIEEAQKEERAALVQQKLQAIQQERLAQNAAAEAEQSVLMANQAIQGKINELARFDEGKPSTAGDIARSIGSAISVAMGAFATGMTGMPNFALQIYNNAIDRDLAKQREQRGSIVNQLQQLGMDQKDAEKYYRSKMDTYAASQMARIGASTPNPRARAEALKVAAQIGTNATKAAAEVEMNLGRAKKAQAETAAIPLEAEVKQLDLARKIDADRMDAINKVLDRAAKKEISANELAVKIKEINSSAALKKQELDLKGKEMAVPEGAEEMNEYQKLKTAFKAEGNKGLAKEVAQTFSVDGVKLLARSEEDAKEKQKLWRGYSSSEKAVDDLVKEIDKMRIWDSLAPTQRAARVESLAAKFAVGYPKSEGFQRALSVADKDVVLKGVLQDPTSFKSWLLGLSSASVKALKQAMEEDKIDMLKNDVVEGDPRLEKVMRGTSDLGINFKR